MQPGIIRAARRPQGWTAPGPRPPPCEDLPGPGEDLCWLAGEWRIFQRVDGHRFSLDDLVTAHLAAELGFAAGLPLLDLGCGIGSVLLFLAWRFPEARCLGVEAQPVSAALARRSIALNGARGRVLTGDFREPAVLAGEGPFGLVTGTPPYFPRGTGVESRRVQRAPCRFEHRGGIEDYCAAAARVLAEDASFVACAPARDERRVAAAAAGVGLALVRYRPVIGRAGKPPLFAVFAMRRQGRCAPEEPLVIRGYDGRRTEEFVRLRAEMGMPP